MNHRLTIEPRIRRLLAPEPDAELNALHATLGAELAAVQLSLLKTRDLLAKLESGSPLDELIAGGLRAAGLLRSELQTMWRSANCIEEEEGATPYDVAPPVRDASNSSRRVLNDRQTSQP